MLGGRGGVLSMSSSRLRCSIIHQGSMPPCRFLMVMRAGEPGNMRSGGGRVLYTAQTGNREDNAVRTRRTRVYCVGRKCVSETIPRWRREPKWYGGGGRSPKSRLPVWPLHDPLPSPPPFHDHLCLTNRANQHGTENTPSCDALVRDSSGTANIPSTSPSTPALTPPSPIAKRVPPHRHDVQTQEGTSSSLDDRSALGRPACSGPRISGSPIRPRLRLTG